MLESLATVWNVVLVLIGFGFVIFWHELGHFVTARWAKIRVLEFAVGFGPAIFSYRKGLGLRRGSTNAEYEERLKKHRYEAGENTDTVITESGRLNLDKVPGVSQTEYRLNWIPLGGYVRMLGQEDANPSATSSAPDSYTQVPVWKRLIVVSGGVIMNVILAAALFIGVYSVGLESRAPAISIDEESPAYRAGMRTGDVVRSVNGERVEVFQDLLLQVGLSKKGRPLNIEVDRQGEGTLTFEVEPEYDDDVEIRAIGAYSLPSATIITPADEASGQELGRVLTMYGLEGVEPGWDLVRVNGEDIDAVSVEPWGEIALPTALLLAADASDGAPVVLEFVPSFDDDESGADELIRVTERFELIPQPEFDVMPVAVGEDVVGVRHLLGLTPPLMVRSTSEAGAKAGLMAGDIFAQLGDAAWPDTASGIGAIREKSGASIAARVLRDGEIVDLTLPVSGEGTVGFAPDASFDHAYLSATPTPAPRDEDADDEQRVWAEAASIASFVRPGSRLTSVNGTPVDSLIDARGAMIEATMEALSAKQGATIMLGLTPAADGASEETVAWTLDNDAVAHLHSQGWSADGMLRAFAPAMITQIGENPVHSINLGLRETQRMLTRVYLTLGRLADGSVKPQQLKGPVGITHIGSRVAEEGMIRLLFFIGLISANLAVLNFLPLPIVDGGLFLMLCYEGVTKKPVPVAVQNALTIIGLIGIVAVFLFVTTNDVLNLFG